MSLPPALLKRLKNRGLVQKQNATGSVPEAIEEIIAENYDDDDKVRPHSYKGNSHSSTKRHASDEHMWTDRIKERIGVTESFHGYKLCPNKYNVWHKCNLYCVNKWTNVRSKPTEKYLQRYKRLLRKYPLEAGWKDVYDSGCGSYYFYNTITQRVSWLPPSHPKARVSQSAAVFRRQLANTNDEYNFDTSELILSKTRNNSAFDTSESDNSTGPSVQVPIKKQKVRDLDRMLMRRRQYES
ncbi:uncharacterized protein PQBP1 [Drosophila tropicalis]|uniref:uncharacterized protein PQBP1 n=1 Tax=Drosophila tropicalis TaxID=46794 RepID=UPI0035AB854C